VTPRPFPSASRIPDAVHGLSPLHARTGPGILAMPWSRAGIGIFEYTDRNFLVWGPPSSGPPSCSGSSRRACGRFVSSASCGPTFCPYSLVAVWTVWSPVCAPFPDELKVLTASLDQPDYVGNRAGPRLRRVPHHLLPWLAGAGRLNLCAAFQGMEPGPSSIPCREPRGPAPDKDEAGFHSLEGRRTGSGGPLRPAKQ